MNLRRWKTFLATYIKIMAEANIMSAERLEVIIAEICTKISTLNRRETEINRNTTSEADVVKTDLLLRRIRSERRELNKELAERSS